MSRSDQRRFGDDTDRMVEIAQHFQNGARDAQLLLCRLIGIGVGAHRDGARNIRGRRQFLRQQFRRVRFHQYLRLEIRAGRKSEIGMRRPRKTINAAMLATPIGIDRTIERDIRRGVARDDRARGIADQFGLDWRKLFLRFPAVIKQHALFAIVPAGRVGNRAPSMKPPRIGGDVEYRCHEGEYILD